jgi:RNA polymerase sigma-70 factor, ECF subfamily
MSETATGLGAAPDHGAELLALYDEALPQVYGYLLHRCRDTPTAEDLSAETFLAAVDSIERGSVRTVGTAWLIGIARHKLIDHWRRVERDTRHLRSVEPPPVEDDPWDAELDGFLARDVLDQLGSHHRAVLTLRYVDDLSVPDVASVLDRTVHATEALLVRARRAFRERYETLDDRPARSADREVPT